MKESLQQESDIKGLSSRTEKNKESKKNFYNFRKIYKIEDFYCFSENNSYSGLHPSSSRSPNTTFNANQVLSSFKKNISTYLIVKKHYESNANKYMSLVSKLRYFKEKKQKFVPINNIFINDSLQNGIEELDDPETSRRIETDVNETKQIQLQMPLDIQRFKEIKTINEKNLVEFEFIIESEGNQKQIRKKIDLNKLESKFLKRNEGFLNNPGHSKEFIIESLSENFGQLLTKIKNGPFFIKMPKNFRPILQSFNDFYQYDENYVQDEAKPLKEPENEASTKEEMENNARQFDEILIEQIINENDENFNKKEEPKLENEGNLDDENDETDENEENEENDENDENDENEKNEENLQIDSHKVLKKMQKYLDKNQKTPQSIHIKKEKNIDPLPTFKRPELTQKTEEPKINPENEKNNEELIKTQEKPQLIEENKSNPLLDFEDEIIKKTNAGHVQEIEEEEKKNIADSKVYKSSKMELIDRLLQSKDIFNEDLSDLRPKNFEYPEMPKDMKFADENEKEIFQRIYFWLYEVELQVERDKSDIEHYENDYQNKFLDFLIVEPGKKMPSKDDISKSSEEGESDGEESEEAEDESGSEK